MTTSTLEGSSKTSQDRPVPIEIKFSKESMPGEPELDLMERVVDVVESLIAQSSRPAFALGRRRSATTIEQEQAIVTDYLSDIVMQAIALFEQDGVSWRPVRETPYYALYVFGLFRFGLSMKHLTALSSRLIREGDLPSGDIRSLCNKQARVARRHAPHSTSTPLADLGLNLRY